MTRSERIIPGSAKTQVYSDFLTNLNKHPVSGDIVRFVDEKAVIRSIKNLLLTDKGERPYQPNIGSNIRKMLFEPMGPGTAHEIASLARDVITEYEPRAKILDIQALSDPDNNRYVLSLTIMIINRQDPVNFAVNLVRVR